MSTEVEYKFLVPRARLADVEAALQAQGAERIEMRAHYYDTEDGRLAAARIGLRLRQENARWVQTVKGPGRGPIERLEHEVELRPEDGAAPLPRIERHEGSPAFALLRSALPDPAAALLSVQGTQMTRLRSLQAQGASRIELALDVGEVTARDAQGRARSAPVCELELELVEGRLEDLRDLALRWAQRHGLVLSTITKAERGLRLLKGQEAGEAVKAQPIACPDAGAAPDGTAIQRAVVANCLAQILPNASEVAQGNAGVAVVHQLRVGLRRLRTALRMLDALHPGHFRDEWQAPLTAVFRALGDRRDEELLRTRLQPQLEAAGAPALALAAADDDAAALAPHVADPAFQAVLITLIAFGSGATPQEAPAASAEPAALGAADARALLARRLSALHKKVRTGGRHFTALSPRAQHRVRKQLKRLRYLAEFAAPLFERKAARRYLRGLTPAQDTLGVYNDHQVALALYRQRAAEDPRALFAVGWLSATLPREAAECRKALGRIRKADRFWKS
ncbi:CYTH and CHAD domain-containing protein [Xenophilus sp. Marseille-Q4582]|uniref:CYTH and CHAD domain-containing protein n=1 Tax=Xenophilus sp. Marseille-Q4582 TaxID=2866600 RepID=UPI001CE3F695|nr:CYTH and CHAD domain-containing protein [Xenophilus sp. Marseille-Q4582]